MLGSNDAIQNVPHHLFEQSYRQLLDYVLGLAPSADYIISTIPPITGAGGEVSRSLDTRTADVVFASPDEFLLSLVETAAEASAE